MTEKKWTKGNWVVDKNGNVIVEGSSGGVGYPPSDGTIASLYDGEYIENDNADNDAHLIAAAPDLAEALESILEADLRGQGEGYAEAMERGVRALAKAYGEEK